MKHNKANASWQNKKMKYILFEIANMVPLAIRGCVCSCYIDAVTSDSLWPLDCSMPGFPVLHHLPELAHTHVHWVGDVVQPSHPLSSPASFCIGRQILYHWDTLKVWRIQTEGFLKPVSRRQFFQRIMPKAEKLCTDSEENPLFPEEWVKGYPASVILCWSNTCSKGNRWSLARFSERAWSQARQKCQLHMPNKAITRKGKP